MHPLLKRFVPYGLALCASFASVSASHAAAPKKPKPRPKVPYMAIASVDTTAMTIIIEAKNSTATNSKTYKFTAKTRITANGHDGTVSDLKPGQQVRVGTGLDENVADELTVSPPPPDPK